MGYIAMSTVVYFIMNMLGEMTTYLPVRGVSVPYFINRFTEPSLGFAVGKFTSFEIVDKNSYLLKAFLGYNYWYSFSMLLASEVTAAGLVIEYWPSSISVGVWIAIILVGECDIQSSNTLPFLTRLSQ